MGSVPARQQGLQKGESMNATALTSRSASLFFDATGIADASAQAVSAVAGSPRRPYATRLVTRTVILIAAFFALLAGLCLGSANAAVLQLNGSGILTGATGVIVDGQSFNVSFQDGTCAALFSGCNSSSDFQFQSLGAAQDASQALLSQVLTDGPAGNFASRPSLTSGCGTDDFSPCFVLTPYEAFHSDGTCVIVFVTGCVPPHEAVRQTLTLIGDPPVAALSLTDLSILSDTTNQSFLVWGVWTPVAAATPTVPEPGSLALAGLGILACAKTVRRRKYKR